MPEQLMRAMAAEAEAARNARAKVIAAEGEHKASRALRHAADVIADSPAALQVRIHTSTRLKDSYHNHDIPPAAVSANPEQHLLREQHHRHLPAPHRGHVSLPAHGILSLRAQTPRTSR